MPKLPTFTAQVGDAAVGGGRRVTAADISPAAHINPSSVTAIGTKLISDFEARESREALVGVSAVRSKYARRLDEAATSGEDLEVLKQKMNDELSRIGEGFTTKVGQAQLNLHTSNSNTMFDEQSNTIAIRRATFEATRDTTAFLNSVSTIIRDNPGYLETAEVEAGMLVDTFINISPENKAVIKQRLVSDLNQASAIAVARTTPEIAIQQINAGLWTLTAEQRDHAIGVANTTIQAHRANEAYQRAQRELIKKEKNEDAFDRGVKGVFEGERDMMNKVMNDNDLLAPTRLTLANLIERRTRELRTSAYKTNPRTFNRIRALIDKPPGDPGRMESVELLYAHYGVVDGLSLADTQTLERRILDNKSPEGIKLSTMMNDHLTRHKSQLDKNTMLRNDSTGPEKLAKYTQFVNDRVADKRAKREDWTVLFDVNHPEYVGNSIATFQSASQELSNRIVTTINEALDQADRAKRAREALEAQDARAAEAKVREDAIRAEAADPENSPAVVTPATDPDFVEEVEIPIVDIAPPATQEATPKRRTLDEIHKSGGKL